MKEPLSLRRVSGGCTLCFAKEFSICGHILKVHQNVKYNYRLNRDCWSLTLCLCWWFSRQCCVILWWVVNIWFFIVNGCSLHALWYCTGSVETFTHGLYLSSNCHVIVNDGTVQHEWWHTEPRSVFCCLNTVVMLKPWWAATWKIEAPYGWTYLDWLYCYYCWWWMTRGTGYIGIMCIVIRLSTFVKLHMPPRINTFLQLYISKHLRRYLCCVLSNAPYPHHRGSGWLYLCHKAMLISLTRLQLAELSMHGSLSWRCTQR